MDLDEALADLPDDSPYREAFRGYHAGDEDSVRAGREALRKFSRPYWEPPVVVPEPIAVAVVRAALGLRFPEGEDPDDDGAEAIVFTLIGSAHPRVLDLAEAGYAGADEPMRLDLLTVIASAPTRRGAELFAALVARHGWPKKTHQRILIELGKNVPHAEALFPGLLAVDGAPAIAIGDLLLQSLRAGTLRPAAVDDTAPIRALAPRIRELAARLPAVRARPLADRSDDERNVERELAMVLDLAAFAGGPTPPPRRARPPHCRRRGRPHSQSPRPSVVAPMSPTPTSPAPPPTRPRAACSSPS